MRMKMLGNYIDEPVNQQSRPMSSLRSILATDWSSAGLDNVVSSQLVAALYLVTLLFHEGK